MIKAFLFKTLLGKIIVGVVATGVVATAGVVTYNYVIGNQEKTTPIQQNDNNKQDEKINEEQKQEEPVITNPMEKIGYPKEIIHQYEDRQGWIANIMATKFIFNDDYTIVAYTGVGEEGTPHAGAEIKFSTEIYNQGTYKIIDYTEDYIILEITSSKNNVTNKVKFYKVDGLWKVDEL